ncbi:MULTISPECIES: Na+/H+ antiporter [unclassified Beijerinckia]|uniref:Na+/H+ antiporter n=1 Tax=unclassified Beijerinckia TaxID=2638183 RepID=UPI000897BFB3|nr:MULTISPECIES: Na+/H+ antiporter [unclassified Beijerinckia]MDH7796154.1 Na+/H+ antiporter [Beijerinckia sp. GAS462]SEC32738.1 sodium/proton antiporter, CPA1 family [Beijerinckia sp. 28-YEA-48]
MATATFILLLLVLVALSGVIVRFVPIPLPIIQIVLGVLLAWPADGLQVGMNPEIFMLVFIPPLLFIEGVLAPKREFDALKGPILGLAFGLVFLTILVFGFALNWLLPVIPLPVAFALAAVLAPTDAVAVGSIINKNLVPSYVMHVLEGESLLNDASGLVVFRFAVAAALTGQFSPTETVLSFIAVVIGGVLCGGLMLVATAKLLRVVAKVGDVRSEVQVLILLLLPFAAYLLAEYFHASGILAAVTAGLYISASGLFGSLSVPARLQNMTLIEVLSFVFNGGVFLLLGLQLPEIIRKIPAELSLYGTVAEPIIAVFTLTLILLAIRFAWINWGSFMRGVIERLSGKARRRASMRIKIVMSLAGVRGAITLAGILSLPLVLPNGSPFPARDLVIFIAAGVIICSILIASVTLPFVARGIPLDKEDVIANEERLARVTAAEAAIARIELMVDENQGDADKAAVRQAVASQLIAIYQQYVIAGENDEQPSQHLMPVITEMREAALQAETVALAKLMREKKINDTTMRMIMTEITMQQALTEQRKTR